MMEKRYKLMMHPSLGVHEQAISQLHACERLGCVPATDEEIGWYEEDMDYIRSYD